jgi:cytochrome b
MGFPVDPAAGPSAPAPYSHAPLQRRLRVWDLPTRLFHWTLAASVIASLLTGYAGGNAMVWHFRLGELALALLVFRLMWGLLGGHWSRFGTFFYGPGALLRYLRGKPKPQDRFDIGHSPLGSLSVWALLLLLVMQVGTGLVADDEIANVGPLNRFVSSATASVATGYHKHLGQRVLIVLLLLHVTAVLFYLVVRRRNLLAPMWHGDKPLDAVAGPEAEPVPSSRDDVRSRLLALVLFAACCAGVWGLMSLS